MNLVLIFAAVLWMSWLIATRQQKQERELGRFRASEHADDLTLGKRIDRWFESLGRRAAQNTEGMQVAKKSEREMAKKLRAAGLESVSDHGKYAAVRLCCYGSWPIICSFAWSSFSSYYATVTTIFSFAIVVILPHLWLSRRTIGRLEDIQRELPLVIDLTNLSTSAGYDLSTGLERVIDSLAPHFPRHPLIRELKKARLLATSGYSWNEAMARVARKMSDDTVTRVAGSLVQAIEQGGDRSAQLAGISQDAQRTYYTALDKRLAAIPVKALMITLMLFLTYFAILLAPALAGVGNSVSDF